MAAAARWSPRKAARGEHFAALVDEADVSRTPAPRGYAAAPPRPAGPYASASAGLAARLRAGAVPPAAARSSSPPPVLVDVADDNELEYWRVFALHALRADPRSVEALPFASLADLVAKLRLPATANLGRARLQQLFAAHAARVGDGGGGGDCLGFRAFLCCLGELAQAAFTERSAVMGDRVPPARDALARLMFEHVLPHVSSALRMPHGVDAPLLVGHFARDGGVLELLRADQQRGGGGGAFDAPLHRMFGALTRGAECMSFALFHTFCTGFLYFKQHEPPLLGKADLGSVFVHASTADDGAATSLSFGEFATAIKGIALCAARARAQRRHPLQRHEDSPADALRWLLLRINGSSLHTARKLAVFEEFNAACERLWPGATAAAAVESAARAPHAAAGAGGSAAPRALSAHARKPLAAAALGEAASSAAALAPPMYLGEVAPPSRPIGALHQTPGAVATAPHAAAANTPPGSVQLSLSRLRRSSKSKAAAAMQLLAGGGAPTPGRSRPGPPPQQQHQHMARLAEPKSRRAGAGAEFEAGPDEQKGPPTHLAHLFDKQARVRVHLLAKQAPPPPVVAPAAPAARAAPPQPVVAPPRPTGPMSFEDGFLGGGSPEGSATGGDEPAAYDSSDSSDISDVSSVSSEGYSTDEDDARDKAMALLKVTIKLQCFARRKAARARTFRHKRAIEGLQSRHRGRLGRRRAVRHLANIVLFQSRARGFAQRKELLEHKCAALVMQARYRGHRTRKFNNLMPGFLPSAISRQKKGHQTTVGTSQFHGKKRYTAAAGSGPHISAGTREALWPDREEVGLLELARECFDLALFRDGSGEADCEHLATLLRADKRVRAWLEVHSGSTKVLLKALETACLELEDSEVEGIGWLGVTDLLVKYHLTEDYHEEVLEQHRNLQEMHDHMVEIKELDDRDLLHRSSVTSIGSAASDLDDALDSCYDEAATRTKAAFSIQEAMEAGTLDGEGGGGAHEVQPEDVDFGMAKNNTRLPHFVASAMGFDIAMVFPCSKRTRPNPRYDVTRFQNRMLGLTGLAGNMLTNHHAGEHIDPNRVILKTPRCMLSEDKRHNTFLRNELGEAVMSSNVVEYESRAQEQRYLDQFKDVLKSEWIKHFHSDMQQKRSQFETHDAADAADAGDEGGGGGGAAGAKHKRKLKVSDTVEVERQTVEGAVRYADARIDRDNGDSTFNVRFDSDGAVFRNIPSDSIRKVVEFTSPRFFQELVAKSICQRLQIACGLETEMYYSYDLDEVVCTVKADENDLRTEASRINYRMQVRLQPFSAKHKAEDARWRQLHRDHYIKSMHHLARCCDHRNPVTPEMDPLLFKPEVHYRGPDAPSPIKKKKKKKKKAPGGGLDASNLDELVARTNRDAEDFVHAKLVEELARWGHNPAIDWDDVSVMSLLAKEESGFAGRIGAWVGEVLAISPMPHNYFAPYVEYKAEDKYQPYFRHYVAQPPRRVVENEMRKFNSSMRANDGTQFTLFRDVDRIRLTTSIITRHINTDAMRVAGIMKSMYGLHQRETLRLLKHSWALKFEWKELWGGRRVPLLQIRDYFGEKIGLYFAFVDFNAKMLIPPMLYGVGVWAMQLAFTPGESAHADAMHGVALLVFALVISTWATLFSELWKRKNALINLWWGTTGFHASQVARPQFVGTVRRNPVNNLKEAWYFSQGQLRCRLLSSAIFILLLMTWAIAAIGGLFFFKDYLVAKKIPFAAVIGGIAFAGQIAVMNEVYKIIAKKLTSWENHRTDSAYEANMITKAFVFQFINSYGSCFYIAFLKESQGSLPYATCTRAHFLDYIAHQGFQWNSKEVTEYADRIFGFVGAAVDSPKCNRCTLDSFGIPNCLGELQLQLATIFISRLVGQNISEILSPVLQAKAKIWLEGVLMSKEEKAKHGNRSGMEAVRFAEQNYEQAEYEAKLHKYEDVEFFNDYNELIIQYGYVVLFVVAFPLAPLLAFLNNIAEIHVDGFKLTKYRRPHPDATESIGAWFYFLGVMSTASVVTNCAIIFFSSDLLTGVSTLNKLTIFLCVENGMLFLKRLLEVQISDTPQRVQNLVDRYELIMTKVFKGLGVVEEASYEEAAEDLDLEIRSNPRHVIEGHHAELVAFDGKKAEQATKAHEASQGGGRRGKQRLPRQSNIRARQVKV